MAVVMASNPVGNGGKTTMLKDGDEAQLADSEVAKLPQKVGVHQVWSWGEVSCFNKNNKYNVSSC
jgi:hypothetical protein